MQTLIKILEKIGEHMAWAGWMYGAPVPRPPHFPRPPHYPRPPKDGR